jgi:hypothetical protein
MTDKTVSIEWTNFRKVLKQIPERRWMEKGVGRWGLLVVMGGLFSVLPSLVAIGLIIVVILYWRRRYENA